MSTTKYYICKVFTSDFKERLDIEIKKEIEVMMNEANIPEEHRKLHHDLVYKQRMNNFRNMWTEPSHYEMKFPETVEYYKQVGLWEPEFNELHLEAREQPFQTQPRIDWSGEVLRIEDIDEIYSYKVDHQPNKSLIKLLHIHV